MIQNPKGFVDWSARPIYAGASGRPPHFKSQSESLSFLNRTRHSAVMLSNQTDIQFVFQRTVKNFKTMYAKRAFVHWYVSEGLQEGFFGEAYECFRALDSDYDEMRSESPESEPMGIYRD